MNNNSITLTKLMKDVIAEIAATENLETVNRISVPVNVKRSFYILCGKRIFDILIALVCLLITLPINLILALLTFIDVGWPIFFKQKRTGRHGEEFTIIKFRNMTNEVDQYGELLPASKRVTRFGKFVRRTSLDELLNFWCVLNGSMSIIGCRPLKTYYLLRYSDRHIMRHALRPGLECPVLINSGKARSWQEQFENDVWYVENCSLLVDIRMLFKLVKMVFDRKSTKVRANVTKGGFIGYDESGMAFGADDVPENYIDLLINRLESENDSEELIHIKDHFEVNAGITKEPDDTEYSSDMEYMHITKKMDKSRVKDSPDNKYRDEEYVKVDDMEEVV